MNPDVQMLIRNITDSNTEMGCRKPLSVPPWLSASGQCTNRKMNVTRRMNAVSAYWERHLSSKHTLRLSRDRHIFKKMKEFAETDNMKNIVSHGRHNQPPGIEGLVSCFEDVSHFEGLDIMDSVCLCS